VRYDRSLTIHGAFFHITFFMIVLLATSPVCTVAAGGAEGSRNPLRIVSLVEGIVRFCIAV
jgi:hypothetical protein